MILHRFQAEVVAEIERKIAEGVRRILVAAPTGSGKTVIASEIIKRTTAQCKRNVFIAHRDEMLTQARDKLRKFDVYPRHHQERARQRPATASVGTGLRNPNTARSLPPADIAWFDEAHHVRARTYQTIIEAYPDAIIIGLTATPARGDGRGLGNVFEVMIEAPQIGELIKLGHLVPLKIFAPPLLN